MDECTKTSDIKSFTQSEQISNNGSHKYKQIKSGNIDKNNIDNKDTTTTATDTFEKTKVTVDDDDFWNDGEGWGVNEENEWEVDESSIENATKEKGIQQELNKNLNVFESNDFKSVSENNNLDVMNFHKKNNNNSNRSSDTWTNWGRREITSVLSTAGQSVSTLTSSVSQSISTVLENSIGILDPEKLTRLNHAETDVQNSVKNQTESQGSKNENLIGFSFGNISNLVSGVSKLVESTSTKIVSGGLDTLETIGKKTMDVLQEGDPGLKKKRAFLTLDQEKPVLSHLLKEAKENAEKENKLLKEKQPTKNAHYETLLDNYHAFVHLEALELLSKQCDIKLQTITASCTGKALIDIQETMDQVKELCELPDQEDELMAIEEAKERLKSAVDETNIYAKYDKLIGILEQMEDLINNSGLSFCDESEFSQQVTETLAQITAVAIEQFHKTGELLLLKTHHSTTDEADSLVRFTTALTSLIGTVAAKFSEKLNSIASSNSNEESVNSLITNVFFEASKSSSYIQNAFNLLIPVLQVGAI